MQEMYPIAIPIDLKHKRKHKILYSHIEANTHDYMDMNFENKSGTYDFGIHLPMNNMYSIAMPVAPVHKTKT